MACQYAEGVQHDWRNPQFVNYNMLQQAPFNTSHQDVPRTDYSALFDANYAMAQAAHVQAQVAHAHSSQSGALSTFNPAASRSKSGAEKDAVGGGHEVSQGPDTWAKGGEWGHQLGMGLQPENLSYNANEVFGSQYSMNAAKNYWT